jgi:hypothetical protein
MYEIIDDSSGVQICLNSDISSLFKNTHDTKCISPGIQFQIGNQSIFNNELHFN